MLGSFRRVLQWRFDSEGKKLTSLFLKYVDPKHNILDIGCGYGRNIRNLTQAGFKNITGVDANDHIVAENVKRGLKALTLKEFKKTKEKFEVILMSHVIEHMQHHELLLFLDEYLNRLTAGGYLVIVTPLHSAYFYDDFDHVKPYQPIGFAQILSGNQSQIQYYARNRVHLSDLWFRKNSQEIRFHRSLFFRSGLTDLIHLINFLSHLIFLMSFRLVGKTDGWIGFFKKQ